MERKIKVAVVFTQDPVRPILIVADHIIDLTQQLHAAILKYGEFELIYRVYT